MSINLSGRALKRLRLPVVNYYSSAYQVMSAQAGDVNTRYLDVVLYDDRGDIDLGAYSKVYLQVQAYDGISPQMSEGWIDTERNRAVCRLTSSMLQYTGSKMPCNIWLVGTDADDEPMSLTSQTFYVMVYEGHGGTDAEPSEDELTALQSAINDVVELEKTVGEAEANRQENFRSVYIKYSFDANGYNYTDSWQQGQQYMGVANTSKEPEDAAGFSWILISGGSSGGSAVTVVGKNGYGFYRLVGEYTDDTTDVATEDIQRRADREVQAGDMLITSEGLIFVLDEYDADNDTQKVSYYTDIGGGDVSEEAIAAAVEMYMSENEIGGIGADDIDIVDSDGSYKLILTKDGEHIGSGVNMPAYTAEDVGAAEKGHNHDEKYQPKGNYAAEGHDHDDKYQAKGDYAAADHNHDGVYAKQTELNDAVNTALETAKESGDFNGASVTVSKVTESSESGGSNVVEFSDGNTLTVKNGKDGQEGISPTVTVNKSGKVTTIQVVNADGTVSTSTVNDGSDGKDGEDGYAQMIPLEAESTDWLLENGDTTKQYLLPDGFFYKYEETTTTVPGTPGTTEPLFTNILPLAVDANGNDYVGANGEDGYKTGTRLNSSKVEKDDHDDMCCTGFVPIDPTDGKYILRIKGIKLQGSVGGYFYLFGDDRATGHGSATAMTTDFTAGYDSASDTYTLDLSTVSGLAEYKRAYYFRLSCGGITDNTIMTWNEEIEYKTTGATEPIETITKAWVSTGRAFIPADYEEEILDHETRITALENNGVGGGTTPGTTLTDAEKLARIATWDKPIFDELEPYLVPTGEEMTVPAEAVKGWNSSTDPNNTYRKAQVQMVYDTYTELCETYPEYVREITDADNGIGGLCSDGEQMVRVYEFCELDGRHYNAAHTKKSETKLTIIVSAGIHKEWGGLYGVTKALTRIAEDPKLRYLRRNCRFIVVPVLNPYCFLDYNATSGVKNYNGVNIHVAFDDVLAEIEAQYLDNIFKKYSDAAFYLSCHSAQIDTTYGVAFVWPSAGSYYTCNLGFHIIDMMSFAWEQKYGTETWRNKVAAQNNKTDANGARLYTALPVGDYRVGHASISNTLNSEYKHALKYGIQGMNVEIIDTFHVLSSVGLDSYAITHGAEMYINLFRLAASNFNITDKTSQYE